MRRFPTIIVLTLFMTATHAGTGGWTEPAEPVNVVVETGQDVGACEAGGSLSYPPPPYKGSAYFLLKADPKLAARHRELTRSQLPWLQRLDGPSGTNRLFTGTTGETAIVFWSCKPHDCGDHATYGAYAPRSGRYTLRVLQHGQTTTLGDATPLLDAAIACARAQDEQSRERSSQALKRAKGQ